MKLSQCYSSGWCHKLTALTIAASYFILLIFINNTTYIWATLALFFVIFVTTFTCSSTKTPLLLQLRGTRAGALTNQAASPEGNTERQGHQETTTPQHMTIWVTDVPPSYNIVMADMPPPTPPPSYGSAILMFPPAYVGPNKNDEGPQEAPTSPQEGPRRFRPLSISTQVSVAGSGSECTTPIGMFSFSTQISVVNGSSDPFADTLSLRTRLFLSRQVSREDIPDGEGDSPQPMNAIELHSYEIPIVLVNGLPEHLEENDAALPEAIEGSNNNNEHK